MNKPRTELQSVLWTLRRGWWAVAIFSGVANVLMLAPTLYMLQVYDRVLISQSGMTLLVVSVITLFLLCVMAFSEALRSRLLVRLGVKLDAALARRVFNASFESNALQANSQPSKVFSDVLELRQFLTGHGIIAFLDAPWTPVYIGVLFLLHPTLGWVACVFALLQATLAWQGHQRAVAPAADLQAAQQSSSQGLREMMRQIEAVQPMGMWPALQARWLQGHEAYRRAHLQLHAASHRLTAWSKGLRYSQQSLSLAAGAWLVIYGEMSVGAMIAGNVLMTRALAPIDQMVGLWRQWLGARAAYQRLDNLLEAHPERQLALRRTRPTGALNLRGVSAWLSGRQTPILDGIDLSLKPGTVTVIVGPSGSGKSTLARVMLGIWPQVSGEVSLDGLSISEWDRSELGPYLGYLPQSVELFQGSVAQNIARFDEVNPQAVVQAAEQAGLHSLLLQMPQGYDTPVGEVGERLSGGQRQRIGLARALYANPALLVLDEPNAHLDDAGEAALAQAVRDMKARGQTVVLITHRPAIVAQADHLVLLRAGRIQWQGPREQAHQLLDAGTVAKSATGSHE
ncbi:type I secretion system permease/ATPase [Limnohabitans sp. Bal53]|uniref:type I secretion system permease/ATPase n=1 Tax=Limnohabitans sp. Bal53 TaxID=1977910 RepID=UPI000D393961|nr:type I secretion system permease/ATPase [Limnohabitans sp. Bal53]PUE41862.1 type I secretion system permease/ATPase [Limnohabitans sp. Bal53]